MFTGFCGNSRLLETLSRELSSGHLSHAIILEGKAGLGKYTLAKYIAAAKLCGGASKPCLECASCKSALSSTHPDIIEYTGTLKVDDIRDIREQAYIAPNQSDGKVFIISQAGLLNPQSQNALLKVIEEPPKGVSFVLCTTSRNELLQTILSRCVTYTLEPVSDSEVHQYLCTEFPRADASAVEEAVSLCSGNIGMAQALLSKQESGKHFDISISVAGALSTLNEWELLKSLAPLEKDKTSFPQVLEDVLAITARALELRSGYTGSTAMFEPPARKLAKALTLTKLRKVITVLDKFKKNWAFNPNYKLTLTSLCSELMSAVCA